MKPLQSRESTTADGSGRNQGRSPDCSAGPNPGSVPCRFQLVAEERTLKGSYVGSCVPSRDIPRYVALYRAGRLPVDRLLSETIALADIKAAFDRLADGKTVRQVIVF